MRMRKRTPAQPASATTYVRVVWQMASLAAPAILLWLLISGESHPLLYVGFFGSLGKVLYLATTRLELAGHELRYKTLIGYGHRFDVRTAKRIRVSLRGGRLLLPRVIWIESDATSFHVTPLLWSRWRPLLNSAFDRAGESSHECQITPMARHLLRRSRAWRPPDP